MPVLTISRNISCERDIVVHPLAAKVTVGILLIGIAITGVLGNLLTCAIVYRKAPMRSAINLLLTNIAFADLVLCGITVPFIFYRLMDTDQLININVCIGLSVVKDTAVAVTSFTMVIISVDRFLIIVYKKDKLCVGMAKNYIASVWCISLFLTFPQFLSNIKETLLFDDMFCTKKCIHAAPPNMVYTTILLTTTYFLPVIMLLYLYAAILRTVQLTSKRIHNHSGSAISVSVTQYSSKLGLPPVAIPYRFTGDLNAKRRAFGTILILYITLLMCWLPYMAKRIADDIAQKSSRDQTTYFILLTIGVLKSALYPIIFCLRNKKFRVACLNILPSQFKIPRRCLRIKSRRINPKAIYECSETESRL